VVTIEAARKQAARVVAAVTIVLVEVRPPKCKTCNAKLRIGRGVGRRANASKTFSGAVAIDGAVAAIVGAAVVVVVVVKEMASLINEPREREDAVTSSGQVTPNDIGIMLLVA